MRTETIFQLQIIFHAMVFGSLQYISIHAITFNRYNTLCNGTFMNGIDFCVCSECKEMVEQ